MDLDTSDLDAQIAALKAARDKVLRKADQARLSRDKEEARILIGTTPTKPAVKG